MTDTPRTKAAIQIFGDYIRSEPAVPVDFAEELEVELSDAKTELAEARAEIERLKCCTNCGSRLWAATGKGNCKNCKDFSAWTSQNKAALAAEGVAK
jgi:hypothetical protein